MGAAIPRVITPSSASGAQVIDGSLKFDGGYLTRTPSSNGNRRPLTYSCWVKLDQNTTQAEPLFCAGVYPISCMLMSAPLSIPASNVFEVPLESKLSKVKAGIATAS